MYGGCGHGPFLTNAHNVSSLKGPFTTFNINTVAFGLQLAVGTDNDGMFIWTFAATGGPGWWGSVSSYDTNTIVILGKRIDLASI